MIWDQHFTAGLSAFALAILAVHSAVAGGKVNTGYFGGVAIGGYDTVAYFAESRAVKGSPDLRYEFLGETWYFSKPEHRDAFAANPVAYAPQYGGFCAGEVLYADVSTGVTTNIDPETWRIIDGKLYLFYDGGTAAVFEENAGESVEKANRNWPTVEARLIAK
jgi:YHS domain-containing protein